VASGIAARFYMNRNLFINDPEAFNLCAAGPVPPTGERQALAPVSLEEAQSAIAPSAVSGGTYEIGDDLPQLGRDQDRLALVRNRELPNMAKLGKSSMPMDLLSHSPEDQQPSIFLLRQERRQSILTVFSWTDMPRSHTFRPPEFGFRETGHLALFDVLNGETEVPLEGADIRIREQKPHSVRMLKIIDRAIPAAAPLLKEDVPAAVKLLEIFRVSAEAEADGPAALDYSRDFGDRVTAQGRNASHAYTTSGEYTIEPAANGLDGITARRSFRIAVTGRMGRESELKLNRRYKESNGR
jgi:alpha-galactosidase